METPISTLKPGTRFRLNLGKYGQKTGRLIRIDRGSVFVEIDAGTNTRDFVDRYGQHVRFETPGLERKHWALETEVEPLNGRR